jgi:hypothetical protein
MKLPTFIFSHQNDREILILVAEEISDLGVQDFGNDEKSRNGGRNLSIFDFGEEAFRKIGSRSQLLQAHRSLQADRAYSLTDILLGSRCRHILPVS